MEVNLRLLKQYPPGRMEGYMDEIFLENLFCVYFAYYDSVQCIRNSYGYAELPYIHGEGN